MTSIPLPHNVGEVQKLYSSRSNDQGQHWQKPIIVSREAETSVKQSPTAIILPNETLMAGWIDMRHYKVTPPSKFGDQAVTSGFSALMMTRISIDNSQSKELLISKEFCECCPPAILAGENETFFAFRGHTINHIRDPKLSRINEGQISAPISVHDDHWVFDGCPSRGPVVASLNDRVAVAWVTTVANNTRIRLAFSDDRGQHFAPPIEVGSGNVDAVSGIGFEGEDSVLFAWTIMGNNGAEIKLARITQSGRIEGKTTVHSLTGGKTYKWPGPYMLVSGRQVFIAWDDEQDKKMGLTKIEVK